MEKILFALMALTVVFAACNNAERIGIPDNTNDGDEIEVRLSINTSGIELATRSFLDDIALMNEHESRISNYYIYIFDKDGKFIKSVSQRASDIKNYLLITMPREYAQTELSFYVTANYQLSSDKTVDEKTIQNITEIGFQLKNYNNSDVDKLIDGTGLSSNFPYSGYSKVRMNEYGWMNEVDIELSCLMCKVAFEFSVDPDFALNHNGSMIRINNVSLANTASTTYHFNPGTSAAVGRANFQQNCNFNSDGVSRQLWYAFKSWDKAYTYIYLSGLYDKDGDFSTTGDQVSIYYNIPVSDFSQTGYLERGVCYRINGVIKGLGDNNIEATFSTVDWVVPDIKDLPIGY